MITQVQEMLDQYWAWLKSETKIQAIGDQVEITTPFLDRHNDCLQIYARREPEGFLLTDGGYTLEDLKQGGLNFDTSRRQALLEATLNGFGVELAEPTQALEVRTSPGDFALRKHGLVQAMLAAHDLYCLAQTETVGLFHRSVAAWLDGARVRYTPRVTLRGKSGLGHRFDLVIPKSPDRPERVVRVVNDPTPQAAKTVVFAWIDTREGRAPDSCAYAVLNDESAEVPGGVVEAMRNYGVSPLLWTAREEGLAELTA